MASKGTVGDLLVKLTLDMGQLKTSVKEMEGTFNKSFASINSAAQTVGRSLLAGFSVGGLTLFAKHLADLGDRLSDLSDQTGLSVEVLGGLRVVAEQNGSSLDAFAVGILRAQKNLGGMSADSAGAAQNLGKIGLSVAQLKELSPDQFLERFAAALATVSNRNERAKIATDLLGKAGAELVPTLLQIADKGLPKLSQETANAYRHLGDLRDQTTALNASLTDMAASGAVAIAKLFGLMSS